MGTPARGALGRSTSLPALASKNALSPKTTTACVQGLTVVIKTQPKPSVFSPGKLNPLRTGQAARRLQRTSSERFEKMTPAAKPAVEVAHDIDDPMPAPRCLRYTFGRKQDPPTVVMDELAPHEKELLNVDLAAHGHGSPATHTELLPFFALAGIDKQSVQTQSMALKKARRHIKPLFDSLIAEKSAKRELKTDKRAIINTMTRRGDSLRYASKVMRGDKEVVLAAVTAYGRALEHASLALRYDKDVVLAAIRQDASAIKFCAESIRNDREIFEAAMAQQPRHNPSPAPARRRAGRAPGGENMS